MSETILKIDNLVIEYGPIQALKGIDVSVTKGQIVAILGSNGAGKTTTLRTISGLIPITAGQILFEDKNISNLEPEKITKLGISQSPEGRMVFYDLTVEENLMAGSYTVNNKEKLKSNLEYVFNLFPILKERLQQIAGTLSGGEQQMLAIGRALMSSPKLLLLDEPSLGLAPMLVKSILRTIKEIAKTGVSVIIVEQNAKQTLKIADYAYVLELGRISQQDEADKLLNSGSLIEAYLGK